jgi:hypothetical protein
LIGTTLDPVHLVWNAGAFFDPGVDGTPGRPRGLEFGVDGELDLDAKDRYQIIASASYVHFLSTDDDQLLMTAGFNWAIGPALELSLVGLAGILAGGDRYGVLLGISPKLRLFDGAL